MTEYRVCKYCVMQWGMNGLELPERHLETGEDLCNHMEEFHGIRVIRTGETEQQAIERCAKKGIVPDISKCHCRDCKEFEKKWLI